MNKVSLTIKEMLTDLVRNPRAPLTKRMYLTKRKGVTFTITVEKGDKLNG